jgi:hypothetical protein
MAQRPFSRRKAKKATIVVRWSLNSDSRGAHAFSALRCGPEVVIAASLELGVANANGITLGVGERFRRQRERAMP